MIGREICTCFNQRSQHDLSLQTPVMAGYDITIAQHPPFHYNRRNFFGQQSTNFLEEFPELPNTEMLSQRSSSLVPPLRSQEDQVMVDVHESMGYVPSSPSECTTLAVPLEEATSLRWISELVSEQSAPYFFPDFSYTPPSL